MWGRCADWDWSQESIWFSSCGSGLYADVLLVRVRVRVRFHLKYFFLRIESLRFEDVLRTCTKSAINLTFYIYVYVCVYLCPSLFPLCPFFHCLIAILLF